MNHKKGLKIGEKKGKKRFK